MSEELKAAQARIACLEGEIAKRDARIVGLELEVALRDQALDRHVEYGKELRAELSAIKAQEPVVDEQAAFEDWITRVCPGGDCSSVVDQWLASSDYADLYTAPVSEAKAQGVVMPERKTKADYGVYIDEFADEAAAIYNAALDEVARLNAAPAAPAADASDVLEQAMYTLISIGYHENSGLVHELRQALAAHSAKGVV